MTSLPAEPAGARLALLARVAWKRLTGRTDRTKTCARLGGEVGHGVHHLVVLLPLWGGRHVGA